MSLLVNPKKQSSLHYVLMDGSMALLREEPNLGTLAGWREVKLARIFASSDLVSIKKRTLIRHSDYVLHLGDCKEFCSKVSTRLKPAQALIVLGDGARWIWDYWYSTRRFLQVFRVYSQKLSLKRTRTCGRMNSEKFVNKLF